MSLRLQHAKGKGRFSGTGHTCNSYDLIQRNIYVDVFQIMYMGIPNLNDHGIFLFVHRIPLHLFAR